MEGIGKHSEIKGPKKHTGINVGETNIDLSATTDIEDRNKTIEIDPGIGKHHDPKKKFYNRKSQVKSAGGYAPGEAKEM